MNKPDFASLDSLMVESRKLLVRVTESLSLSKEGDKIAVYTAIPVKSLGALPWQSSKDYDTLDDAVGDRVGNVNIAGYMPMRAAKAIFETLGGVAENYINGVAYAVEFTGVSAYAKKNDDGKSSSRFTWEGFRVIGYAETLGGYSLRAFDDVVAELKAARAAEEAKNRKGGENED